MKLGPDAYSTPLPVTALFPPPVALVVPGAHSHLYQNLRSVERVLGWEEDLGVALAQPLENRDM